MDTSLCDRAHHHNRKRLCVFVRRQEVQRLLQNVNRPFALRSLSFRSRLGSTAKVTTIRDTQRAQDDWELRLETGVISSNQQNLKPELAESSLSQRCYADTSKVQWPSPIRLRLLSQRFRASIPDLTSSTAYSTGPPTGLRSHNVVKVHQRHRKFKRQPRSTQGRTHTQQQRFISSRRL